MEFGSRNSIKVNNVTACLAYHHKGCPLRPVTIKIGLDTAHLSSLICICTVCLQFIILTLYQATDF